MTTIVDLDYTNSLVSSHPRELLVQKIIHESSQIYQEAMMGSTVQPPQDNSPSSLSSPIPPELMQSIYNQMDDFLIRKHAAITIWQYWTRYRSRTIFKYLKWAIQQAEYLITKELCKKLCSNELQIMEDQLSQARVRFRLFGEQFPPRIGYKIFCTNRNVHYFSGFRMIESGSRADYQTMAMMGRNGYQDIVQNHRLPSKNPEVKEIYEVTNRKEYVQVEITLGENWNSIVNENITRFSLLVSKWNQSESNRKWSDLYSEVSSTHGLKEVKINPTRKKSAERKKKEKKIQHMRELYGFEKAERKEYQDTEEKMQKDENNKEVVTDVEEREFESLHQWASSLYLDDLNE